MGAIYPLRELLNVITSAAFENVRSIKMFSVAISMAKRGVCFWALLARVLSPGLRIKIKVLCMSEIWMGYVCLRGFQWTRRFVTTDVKNFIIAPIIRLQGELEQMAIHSELTG